MTERCNAEVRIITHVVKIRFLTISYLVCAIEAGAGGYTEADLLAELDEMEGGPRVDPSIKAQEL